MIKKQTKNIIIKFLSKIHRYGFLNAAKFAKKIEENRQGFKIPGILERCFVNEHLPPQTKLLLKQTRQKALTNHYKFVWVQNGNVLVRKAENSNIIHISSMDDLGKL